MDNLHPTDAVPCHRRHASSSRPRTLGPHRFEAGNLARTTDSRRSRVGELIGNAATVRSLEAHTRQRRSHVAFLASTSSSIRVRTDSITHAVVVFGLATAASAIEIRRITTTHALDCPPLAQPLAETNFRLCSRFDLLPFSNF